MTARHALWRATKQWLIVLACTIFAVFTYVNFDDIIIVAILLLITAGGVVFSTNEFFKLEEESENAIVKEQSRVENGTKEK